MLPPPVPAQGAHSLLGFLCTEQLRMQLKPLREKCLFQLRKTRGRCLPEGQGGVEGVGAGILEGGLVLIETLFKIFVTHGGNSRHMGASEPECYLLFEFEGDYVVHLFTQPQLPKTYFPNEV